MLEVILVIAEWLAAAGGIIGSFLVAFKRVYIGMCIWIVTNCIWIVLFIRRGQWAPAAMFVVYLISALAGVLKWKPQQKE